MSEQPPRNMMKLFIASFAGAMLGALIGAIAIVWGMAGDAWGEESGNLFLAGLIVFGSSIASAGILCAIRVRRVEQLAIFGYGAIALGTVLLLRSLLSSGRAFDVDREMWLGIALLIYLPGLAIADTCFLLSLASKNIALRILRGLVIAAAWGSILLFMTFIAQESLDLNIVSRRYTDLAAMGATAMVILTLVGTIGVSAAMLLQTGMVRAKSDTLESDLRLAFTCPRCGEGQSLRPGHARCASCRARFFIEIEEPRCECGYVLFNLTGDVCPECGRVIERDGSVDA